MALKKYFSITHGGVNSKMDFYADTHIPSKFQQIEQMEMCDQTRRDSHILGSTRGAGSAMDAAHGIWRN